MRFALCPLLVLVLGISAYGQEGSAGKQHPPGVRLGKVGDEPITYIVPEGMTTPQHLRFELPSQLGPFCGPNSLYLLLRLKGIPVEYGQLVKRLEITPRGCSLAELQELGESYGLPCEVRKVTLKDLDLLVPPFILHINTPASSSQQATEGRDHFVVVTRREVGAEGTLSGVDPSSGAKTVWSPSYLSRNFSGYVLTPRDAPAKSSAVLVLGVVFALLTVGNLLLAFWKPRSR
jgi:ABC-type bacteriocin/lantibiotic exporter with double-glycine peptidase domain